MDSEKKVKEIPLRQIEWKGKKLTPRITYAVLRAVGRDLEERGIKELPNPYTLETIQMKTVLDDPFRAQRLLFLILKESGEIEADADEAAFMQEFDKQKISVLSLARIMEDAAGSSYLFRDASEIMLASKERLKKKMNAQ